MSRARTHRDGDEPTCAQRQLDVLVELRSEARFGVRIAVIGFTLLAFFACFREWRAEVRFDAAAQERSALWVEAGKSELMGSQAIGIEARVRTLENWMWSIEQAKNLKRKQEYDDERQEARQDISDETPSAAP